MSDDVTKSAFYVHIPYAVVSSNLSPAQKILCGTIEALSGEYGYCFAENQTIAVLINMTERSIACEISRLYKIGAIINRGTKKSRNLTLNQDYFYKSQNETYEECKSQNEICKSQNEIYDTLLYNNKNIQQRVQKKSQINYKKAFDVFWGLYPIKQAKEYAFEKFKKLKPHEVDDLIDRLHSVIEYHNQRTTSELFIPMLPYASTFINQKRWRDDIYANQKTTKKDEDGSTRITAAMMDEDRGLLAEEDVALMQSHGLNFDDAVEMCDQYGVSTLLITLGLEEEENVV